MELRLVSFAADSFLLPDSGSLSLGYKCIWMYSYALALDCTGALVWGLAQFTDYVASFSASNPLARPKCGRLCSDLAEQLQLRFLNRILNLKPLSTIRWYARVCPVTIYTCSMEIRFKLPCRWLSTYTNSLPSNMKLSNMDIKPQGIEAACMWARGSAGIYTTRGIVTL